ncbi:hypothetical protein JW906_00245 [bacterium]|nr:hypothetical protein [bacterium]
MNAWINQTASVWWNWMSPMFWQVGLLVLIISLIDATIRKWAWPQVRYAIWLLVLVKLMIPPSWGSPVSVISRIQPFAKRSWTVWRAESLPTRPVPSRPEPTAAGREEQSGGSSGPAVAEQNPVQDQTRRIPPLSLKAWIFFAWIAGILVFSLLLILKMARLRAWHNRQRDRQIPEWFHKLLVQTADSLGLGRIPAVVFAGEAVTPAVYGMFRPVLLLPSGYLDKLSREEAEHVLLHELCHLKRGDLWLNGLYLILHVAYWFNPLLIWTRRQTKHVREICCDLSVAGILGEKTKAYRQTLLNTARALLTENVEPGLGLLGVFEEPFRLVTRLKWLEKDIGKHRRWIPVLSLLSGLALAASVIPMSGLEETGMKGTAGFAGGNHSADKAAGPGIPDFQISLKQTEPATVVILPKSGHPDLLTESALSELKDLLKIQGISPQGDFFFRIWSDAEKTPLAQAIWEVGCPVKKDERVKPPLEINRLPRLQMAAATLRGILPDEKTWQAFAQRVSDLGWIPAFPPAVEIYRTDDKSVPFWTETEMQMQAFDPDAGYPGLDIRIAGTVETPAIVMTGIGPFSQDTGTRNVLKQYIRKNRLPATDQWFFLFYSDPSTIPPGQSRWEMGCELSADPGPAFHAEPPFELRRMPADSLAVADFPYPLETEYPYMPMILQTLTMGYLMNGSAGQAWLDDPVKEGTEVKRSEFFIPVKSTGRLAEDAEAFGKAMAGWAESPAPDSPDLIRPVKSDAPETDAMIPGATGGQADSSQSGFGDKLSNFFRQIIQPAEPRPMVTIEPREPYWAIQLPVMGAMTQMPAVFEKLRNYMQASGIQAAGPPLTWQYDDAAMIPEFEIKWEAGYRLPDSVAVKKPFQVVRIPSRNVITIRYTDGMDEKALNMKLAAWMYHNDYRSLSPNTMIWTNGLFEPGKRITGLVIEAPILKLDDPYPEVHVFNRTERERHELILPRRGAKTLEDEAIEELKKFVKKNKMEILGDYFIQYHTNPEVTPVEDMIWDAGVPIRGEVKVDDPFRINWMHGRDWACVYYEGNHLEIPIPFWVSYILNYIMNGYKAVGLPRKVFRERLSGNDWKVELQVPVQH